MDRKGKGMQNGWPHWQAEGRSLASSSRAVVAPLGYMQSDYRERECPLNQLGRQETAVVKKWNLPPSRKTVHTIKGKAGKGGSVEPFSLPDARKTRPGEFTMAPAYREPDLSCSHLRWPCVLERAKRRLLSGGFGTIQ
jgi:hypothetical protein